MTTVSKQTADRLVFSNAVLTAIAIHGDSIAEAAHKALRLGRELDAKLFVRGLANALRAAEDELRDSDALYLEELTDDAAPRDARDRAIAVLRERFLSARSLIEGAYGASVATHAGLDELIEDRPDLLVAQARNAARALKKLRKPAAKVDGARVDLPKLAAALEGAAGALETALKAVERERREAQQAMIARDQAADRWSRVYGAVGEIMVGLALAAGQDELAARIRPTARRRAGVPDEAPPSGGEPIGEPNTGTPPA